MLVYWRIDSQIVPWYAHWLLLLPGPFDGLVHSSCCYKHHFFWVNDKQFFAKIRPLLGIIPNDSESNSHDSRLRSRPEVTILCPTCFFTDLFEASLGGSAEGQAPQLGALPQRRTFGGPQHQALEAGQGQVLQGLVELLWLWLSYGQVIDTCLTQFKDFKVPPKHADKSF